MDKPLDRSEIVIYTSENLHIEPLKGKDAMKQLKLGCALLEQLGVSYWVSAGTLLGLYRDGQLIPHDTDIDVETLDTQREADIKRLFLDNDFAIGREVHYKGVPMQVAFYSQVENVIFDIYFYVDFDGETVVNYTEAGALKLLKRFINTKSELVLNKLSLPVPHPIEEYLTYRYGNWLVPDKYKVAWYKQAENLTTF